MPGANGHPSKIIAFGKDLIVPGKKPRPFINRALEIREGMMFHYGSDKQNSYSSKTLKYWWGIRIDGVYFWKNQTELVNTEENNVDEAFLRKYALDDAYTWLDAVKERLKALDK